MLPFAVVSGARAGNGARGASICSYHVIRLDLSPGRGGEGDRGRCLLNEITSCTRTNGMAGDKQLISAQKRNGDCRYFRSQGWILIEMHFITFFLLIEYVCWWHFIFLRHSIHFLVEKASGIPAHPPGLGRVVVTSPVVVAELPHYPYHRLYPRAAAYTYRLQNYNNLHIHGYLTQ